MLITMMLCAAILLFVTGTSAQSKTDGAKTTPATQSVENNLRDCSQMLDQSMNEAATCRDAKSAVEQLLAKTEEGEKNALKLAAERQVTIEAQTKTIERLTKIKCSTKTYFFFFKSKTCY